MNFRVVTFRKFKSEFHLNKCNNILTNSAKSGHKDINSECLRTITFYLALRWACNKTKVVFGSLCASNYVFLTVCSEVQGGRCARNAFDSLQTKDNYWLTHGDVFISSYLKLFTLSSRSSSSGWEMMVDKRRWQIGGTVSQLSSVSVSERDGEREIISWS